MKSISTEQPTGTRGDRNLFINAVTLIALGLSILFLNSWDNLVVRTTVGLFWGTFFLIINGPAAIQALREFRKKHDTSRRTKGFSIERP